MIILALKDALNGFIIVHQQINRLITHIHIQYSDDYWYLNLMIGDVIIKQCPVPEETRWNLRKYQMWADMTLSIIEPTPIMYIGGLE